MTPRLSQHLFAHDAAHGLHTLPESCVFTAERGECCVRLVPCWLELLTDCADLGPVALISQSAGAQLARCVPRVEFAPVPEGGEIVELNSGLVADSAAWSHVLAVEEPTCGGCLFSLQFFTRQGEGLWKLLLTREAQLEHFTGMVRHYASDLPVPNLAGWVSPQPPRIVELRGMGKAFAHPVPSETVATTLLAAHRESSALTISVGRSGLLLSGALVPRTLERCPAAFHAYDYNAEIHLAIEDEFRVWRVSERTGRVLEILDRDGELLARLG